MPNQPIILLYTIPEVFYRWNDIVCKMEITEDMCNYYLGEKCTDFYDYKEGENVFQKESEPYWHYPKPSELTNYQISLLIEKNHRELGLQVPEDERELLAENDERFFNYLNKTA